MKLHLQAIAAALLVLGMTACASQYTDSEAPKSLTLDDAGTRIGGPSHAIGNVGAVARPARVQNFLYGFGKIEARVRTSIVWRDDRFGSRHRTAEDRTGYHRR